MSIVLGRGIVIGLPIILSIITLLFCNLAGNYYLTQIAFNAYRNDDGIITYQLSDAQYTLIRISSVIAWMVTAIVVISNLVSYYNKK